MTQSPGPSGTHLSGDGQSITLYREFVDSAPLSPAQVIGPHLDDDGRLSSRWYSSDELGSILFFTLNPHSPKRDGVRAGDRCTFDGVDFVVVGVDTATRRATWKVAPQSITLGLQSRTSDLGRLEVEGPALGADGKVCLWWYQKANLNDRLFDRMLPGNEDSSPVAGCVYNFGGALFRAMRYTVTGSIVWDLEPAPDFPEWVHPDMIASGDNPFAIGTPAHFGDAVFQGGTSWVALAPVGGALKWYPVEPGFAFVDLPQPPGYHFRATDPGNVFRASSSSWGWERTATGWEFLPPPATATLQICRATSGRNGTDVYVSTGLADGLTAATIWVKVGTPSGKVVNDLLSELLAYHYPDGTPDAGSDRAHGTAAGLEFSLTERSLFTTALANGFTFGLQLREPQPGMTWEDQSGNGNDATQTDPGNSPTTNPPNTPDPAFKAARVKAVTKVRAALDLLGYKCEYLWDDHADPNHMLIRVEYPPGARIHSDQWTSPPSDPVADLNAMVNQLQNMPGQVVDPQFASPATRTIDTGDVVSVTVGGKTIPVKPGPPAALKISALATAMDMLKLGPIPGESAVNEAIDRALATPKDQPTTPAPQTPVTKDPGVYVWGTSNDDRVRPEHHSLGSIVPEPIRLDTSRTIKLPYPPPTNTKPKDE